MQTASLVLDSAPNCFRVDAQGKAGDRMTALSPSGTRAHDDKILLSEPPRRLNPVERVWLFLKEKFLSHRLLDDYDAILDVAAIAWNRMAKEPGRLASLCSYPWIMNCVSS